MMLQKENGRASDGNTSLVKIISQDNGNGRGVFASVILMRIIAFVEASHLILFKVVVHRVRWRLNGCTAPISRPCGGEG